MSDDQHAQATIAIAPGRDPQGTASQSQPWVLALLAAVHAMAVAGLPLLTSGDRVLLLAATDAVAGLAAGVALLVRAWRHQTLPDAWVVAVLLLCAVASGIRVAGPGTPWAGMDVVLVVVGVAAIRSRLVFHLTLVVAVLGWLVASGAGLWGRGAPTWALPSAAATVIAIAGLAAVMRAGVTALERTLEELRATADEQAVHDPLTGTANRRGLQMLAQPMIENARRQGEAVHCLYLDVDDFQQVNDGAGAAAGDQVLVAIAEALKASVRATDAVARWAGDEFVMIGPGTGTSPLELERRVRAHLAVVSPVPESVWPARVSIGSATLVPWDDGNLDSLLARAEKDMRLRRTLRRQGSGRAPGPAAPPRRSVRDPAEG